MSEALRNLDFNLRARGNILVENNIFQNIGFLGTNQPNVLEKLMVKRLANVVFNLVFMIFVLRLRPPLKVFCSMKAQPSGRPCSLNLPAHRP